MHITDQMRIAAKGVAASHTQYRHACEVMHTLKGDPQAMAASLKKRKDAHAAYHIALKFLKVATLKANPQFEEDRSGVLQQKIEAWIDGQLNRLIAEEADEKSDQNEVVHRIVLPEEEIRWN